jgi:hypothetical protein
LNKFFLFYNLSLSNVPIVDDKQVLFSKQYCGQLIKKVVKIDSVVQHLIASKTLSEAEENSLRHHKAADKKFRYILTIITDHSNRNDLKAFKAFTDILEATGNTDIAQQILPIYNERVRSSHLIYNFRVRTDLIYTYLYSHSKITW